MGDDRTEVPPNREVNVAVIGAGYAGLCAVRHFASDPRYHVTAYEQTSRIGGVWNYPAGCEDHPEAEFDSPFYTIVYKNLLINLPNDVMALDGYPFPKDGSFASYSSVDKIHNYLEGYVKHFDLGQYIKLRRQVMNVEPWLSDPTHRPGPRWIMTVRDLTNGAESTLIYDSVLVCVGRHTEPLLPEIPGLSNFTGTILHSSKYRSPERYENQTVLVIGGGASGMDISIELSSYAKKVIFFNHGTSLLGGRFPTINEVKSVTSYLAKSVMLADGSEEPCQTIILATGYEYHYPFLSDSCHVKVQCGRVTPLYRHLIHCEYPSMAFPFVVGLVAITPLLDYQIMFYKAVADGRLTLPTTQAMLEAVEVDYQARLAKGPVRGASQHLAHGLGPAALAYVEQLIEEAGLKPYEPAVVKIIKAWRESVLDPKERFTYRSFKLERVDADNYLLVKPSSSD